MELELVERLSSLESFIKRYGNEMTRERFSMIMDAIYEIRKELEEIRKEKAVKKAMETSGLFFLDEMDSVSPDVLAVLTLAGVKE